MAHGVARGAMSEATRVIVKATPALSAAEARTARAHVWTFVFECYYAKKNAIGEPGTDGNEVKGPECEVCLADILPR